MKFAKWSRKKNCAQFCMCVDVYRLPATPLTVIVAIMPIVTLSFAFFRRLFRMRSQTVTHTIEMYWMICYGRTLMFATCNKNKNKNTIDWNINYRYRIDTVEHRTNDDMSWLSNSSILNLWLYDVSCGRDIIIDVHKNKSTHLTWHTITSHVSIQSAHDIVLWLRGIQILFKWKTTSECENRQNAHQKYAGEEFFGFKFFFAGFMFEMLSVARCGELLNPELLTYRHFDIKIFA